MRRRLGPRLTKRLFYLDGGTQDVPSCRENPATYYVARSGQSCNDVGANMGAKVLEQGRTPTDEPSFRTRPPAGLLRRRRSPTNTRQRIGNRVCGNSTWVAEM